MTIHMPLPLALKPLIVPAIIITLGWLARRREAARRRAYEKQRDECLEWVKSVCERNDKTRMRMAVRRATPQESAGAPWTPVHLHLKQYDMRMEWPRHIERTVGPEPWKVPSRSTHESINGR